MFSFLKPPAKCVIKTGIEKHAKTLLKYSFYVRFYRVAVLFRIHSELHMQVFLSILCFFMNKETFVIRIFLRYSQYASKPHSANEAE